MSRLYVLRHGQASFFAADYDQISDLGREQAFCFGRYFAKQGKDLTRVFLGPRRRHAQTLEAVMEGAKGTIRPGVDTLIVPELDEHQVDQFLRCDPKVLENWEGELDGLSRSHAKAEKPEEKLGAFQRLFEALAEAWICGRLIHPSVEPWPDFQRRVWRALDEIRAAAEPGSRSLIITSAGVIGAMCQYAVKCGDRSALELSWRVRNASVTEFLFSGSRFTLDHFNSMAHLESSELWTFR